MSRPNVHIQRYKYVQSQYYEWGWAAYDRDSNGRWRKLRVSQSFDVLANWLQKYRP